MTERRSMKCKKWELQLLDKAEVAEIFMGNSLEVRVTIFARLYVSLKRTNSVEAKRQRNFARGLFHGFLCRSYPTGVRGGHPLVLLWGRGRTDSFFGSEGIQKENARGEDPKCFHRHRLGGRLLSCWGRCREEGGTDLRRTGKTHFENRNGVLVRPFLPGLRVWAFLIFAKFYQKDQKNRAFFDTVSILHEKNWNFYEKYWKTYWKITKNAIKYKWFFTKTLQNKI